MNKVIIIIGLPGSGKTSLISYFNKDQEYNLYHDWGRDYLINDSGEVLNHFTDDDRFNSLISSISNNKNVIIEGSSFCNHKFLCGAEYELNVRFPNIQIEKYYFENNIKDAIANVLYRDYKNGGIWRKLENGNLSYSGSHYVGKGPDHGKRFYEVIIENSTKLSQHYIIPNKYIPLKIQVQDKKFYQGWKALIQE